MLTEEFSQPDRRLPVLLEREQELAELEGLLRDACTGRGRLSLIEGPAGIGKTRLLEEVRRRAGLSEMTVLAARGGELERNFGFGIVRQLLESTLARTGAGERAELLSGAARLAEPVFGSPTTEQDLPADHAQALLHGLYWLVANVAEASPLLLSVDDVQWADEPSLRFLTYLARRLDGVRAAIAIANRTGEAKQPQVLDSLALEARPPIIRPSPLSEAGVGQVVREAFGHGAGPMLFAACHRATGGNPFLLIELLEELRHTSGHFGEISPPAVSRLGPERIARAVLLRVGRIGPQAAALVRAVAVLGVQAEIAEAAELAGLDLAQTRATTGALSQAGVMEPGEPLRFVHPIVRTAIYEDTSTGDRSELHARAARLLADRGAEPESIGLHLLSCDPAGDPARVATLRDAAGMALSRGAPDAAARYLRRALAEPPSDDERPGLLFELGSSASRAGDAHGLELMREGFELTSESQRRAAAGLALGAALHFDARRMDESMLVCERALESAPEADVAAHIEALLLQSGATTPPGRARVAERLREVRLRAATLPDEIAPVLLVPAATDTVITGGPATQAARIAEHALAGGVLLREQIEKDQPVFYPLLWVLIYAGHLNVVEPTLRQAVAQTQAQGTPFGLALASAFTSLARHRVGELGPAEAAANTCLELAPEIGWGIAVHIAAATMVSVLVERGDLERAQAVLDRLEGTYDPELTTSQVLRESRAKLHMARGDPQAALDELLAVARWEQAMKIPGTVVPVPWRSAAALAHQALGETETAHGLAEEELVLAQRFAAPRPIGVATRILGSLGTGDQGIEYLEAAVEPLRQSRDRLELARAYVELGSALRRQRRIREARQRLAEGMDLAQQCGATALLETAHAQLILAGARPRRVALTGIEALTPSEHRVAEMAAEGMTNKDIAQALFVTLRSVEMHLSNAYLKLQITSRRGLLRALHDR